jgi:hypothetical protein
MLSGTQLTRLQVKLGKLQPDALAGNTQLQHLQVTHYSLSGKAEALFSHLQPLQQLNKPVLVIQLSGQGGRPSCSSMCSPDSKQQAAA